MMSSFRSKKSKKIAERLVELENEVKEFRKHSEEIIENCSGVVKKIKDLYDFESFLEEYATAYRYLSSCTASFSEFNCKMEILKLGYEWSPPCLKSPSLPKNSKELGFAHSKGEKRTCVSLVSSSTDGNPREETPLNNVRTVKEEHPRAPSQKSSINKRECGDESINQSFERVEVTNRQVAESDSPVNKGVSLQKSNLLKVHPINSSLVLSDGKQSYSVIHGSTNHISNDGCHFQSSIPRATSDLSATVTGSCPQVPQKHTPSLHHVNSEPENQRKRLTEEKNKMSNEEKNEKCLRGLKIDRELGVVHQVILSHLVSPHEFYVLVKCQELELFEKLKKKLSVINREEYEKSSPKQKASAAKSLGSYALGFSEELSGWMRIKVTDWRTDKNDALIRVFYIDHGSSGLLPLHQTLPMIETIEDYPIFAQKCYLPSIQPTGRDWSEEDKTVFEIFTESTEKTSHLEIEITENNREDGAIGVKLFLPESKICINDKLIEFGVAVKSDKEKSPGRYLPAYAVGETIPVKVTCIAKVNHIFCVKDYAKTEEPDVLQNLISYFNNPEMESAMSYLDKPPRVGGFVVAKYEDGLWYRAQVMKSNPDSGMCRVIFLDYGNTENVSMKNMRKMEGEHFKIPFQMLECLLDDIEQKLEVDKYKAVKYLNERVAEDVTITIKTVVNGLRSFYKVRIFDHNGVDIIDELVSAGHAVLWKKC